MKTQTLYRPIGKHEYALIEASGFRRFPPRLPEQPIFYPVLNEEYAHQIARDWNTKEPESIGYVTAFEVLTEVVARYTPHQVGEKIHTELWIPAKDLESFNEPIVGQIKIVAEYHHAK
ncbi:MAG TPA: ADP-ribosylation/crystallin J1 [Xanthomonadales bacterium]|nr:ADP-ribosylation/crystallin J1 [Xanthomonadales bacterium]